MRILVTGTAGFIGSHIANHLASKSAHIDVTCVDVRAPRSEAHARLTTEVKPYRALLPRVSAGAFDVVVHQAAITNTLVSKSPELSDINVEGVGDLATACARSSTRMVFASSASIYGAITSDRAVRVGDENVKAICGGPLNPYGVSKLQAERRLADTDGLQYTAFRYTNVFGSGESPKGTMACILTQMIKRAVAGAEVDLFSDTLDASRDFVPVSRVVEAVTCAALEHRSVPSGSVYNLGSGVSIRFAEIVEWLCMLAPGGRLRLNLIPNPVSGRYQYRTRVFTLDTESAFNLGALSRADLFHSAETLARSFIESKGHDACMLH